ncbi:hypothetical protein HanXRQr2_Chr06g0271471 [Helianthus annuus]|uniref:Uncharacterized protein n=1 Tax=Helianthus annuus TaxID=4232 RepID=A0A9K3NKX4_HELAN|nr:hypothetical protein HanXRQr2_Chr06g0271471 [Helianthus annuus]KAJ0916459.1 hypothetical protein HanPSC8_Chr06g0261951 [Helianthus annuus]
MNFLMHKFFYFYYVHFGHFIHFKKLQILCQTPNTSKKLQLLATNYQPWL